MARMTPAQYRSAQNRINRRTAVRSLAALRSVRDPTSTAGRRRLGTLLYAVVKPQRDVSRDLALAFFAAQSPDADAPDVPAPPYTAAMTAAALDRFLPQIASGARLAQARTNTAAAMIRHGEQAGRETVMAAADRDGIRWARMDPVPPCCAFCAVMISRGPVYGSDTTGGFEAHDFCTCVAVPVHKGRSWPGIEQFRAANRFYYDHAAGAGSGQQLAAMRRAVEEHGSPI